MKVVCISKENIIDGKHTRSMNISIGKIYTVLDQDTIGYKITNDIGKDYWYIYAKFIPLSTRRNETIDKILE